VPLPRLPRPTRWHGVLALLVAAQWATVAWVASRAAHTGWLYGDPEQTASVHAASRAVLHGHLPADGGGFLWPLLTAPFAAAGSAPSAGLAELVLVQVVVLLPLALLSIAGAVARLAGRKLGTFAGIVWIALPLLAYRLFDYRMRPPMLDRFLPQVTGLAVTTAFPAVVALAAATYLLVRALDSGRAREAADAGLLASAAGALSIPALLLLPSVLAAFALSRRWRSLGTFGAAALPGLLAAVLWHAHAPHADAPLFHWNWGQFHANLMGFREYFWSLRIVEWVAIAGTVALLRRSLTLTVAIGVWFWTTVLLRGAVSDTFATTDPLHPSTAFLGMLLTALPAFVVMTAALPLLVPRLPTRLAPFPRRAQPADD
jgi:hypothetical protein